MKVESLGDMYAAELQEARSLEEQLVDALPRLAGKAGDPALKEAIDRHLAETRAHVARVEAILGRHEANPREHRDQSAERLIGEAEQWVDMLAGQSLRDAGIIASAQRIEHYEIALYGTLAAWADQLGHERDRDELLAILEEERGADRTLNDLAKKEVNPEAAG